MKFPEEPELTRAETETEDSGVSSCPGSKDNVETSVSNWRVLTAGHGGLTGQVLTRCSEEAQYKHNPAARQRRAESTFMGPGTGGPEAGEARWGVTSSSSQAARHCEMREVALHEAFQSHGVVIYRHQGTNTKI